MSNSIASRRFSREAKDQVVIEQQTPPNIIGDELSIPGLRHAASSDVLKGDITPVGK